MNRSLGKRDLIRLTTISTLAEAQMMMNSSIQYAVSYLHYHQNKYIYDHIARTTIKSW